LVSDGSALHILSNNHVLARRGDAALGEDISEICPDAWIFNYTNPVNIVAEAITHHSPVKIVSLCEGPIYFADEIAERKKQKAEAVTR
jgi:alpha-galactosidase/6-phospho-beta-glucosidase family protein